MKTPTHTPNTTNTSFTPATPGLNSSSPATSGLSSSSVIPGLSSAENQVTTLPPTGTNTTPQRIPPLAGLKTVAVLGILACHTGLATAFNACTRMVEVLFVLSGFLMAYNHFFDSTPNTIAHGLNIIKQKLPRLYPVHLIGFLAQWLFVETWFTKPLSYLLTVGVLNLSLQQAWFIGTQFSFNNVSWFLSALIFCYLMTPTLKSAAISAADNKRLLALFVAVTAMRFYIEYLVDKQHRLIPIDLHCNPFVQFLNYALGYLAGVIWLKADKFNAFLKQQLPAFTFSALNLSFIILYLVCAIKFDGEYRPCFVLLSLPVVYALALNRGIAAKLFSLPPLLWLETISLEIFMFHSFILYHLPTDPARPETYAVFLSVTLAASIAYHIAYKAARRYIKKRRTETRA